MPDISAASPSWDVAGPPEGNPIVLLHGAAWTRKMWMPQMEVLSQEYRVFTPDLPGHGSMASSGFTLDAAVQSLEQLIDRELRRPALLVGLSLGGYVAMEFSHRHPYKAAGLVLSGCSVEASSSWSLMLLKIYRPFFKIWSKEWLPKTHSRNVRRMLPPELAEAQIAAGFYFGAYGDALHELHERGFHSKLSRYPGPVLILNGEQDRSNRRAAHTLLANIPRGKSLVVPGAGQLCSLQQPAVFSGAVYSFAKSIGW